MFRKRIFGLPFPVIAGTVTGILVLLVIGFISGALGQVFIGSTPFSNAIAIDKPVVQLPGEPLFSIGFLQVTNTLVSTWISMLVLVIFFWSVTHKLKIIPGRLQNALEFILEWILNFCIEVAGEKHGRKFFPIVTTIFLFVLANAWMGLIPGFGSLLVYSTEGNTFPLFRGANTDINLPLALAIISFFFVLYYGIAARGFAFFKVWFNFGRLFKGIKELFKGEFKSCTADIFMGSIDAFVGFLEFISYMARNISFTFRLFGNMTGGEVLILMMTFLVPWVLATPFYGLELLIGSIQAIVFAGLTLVFASVAVNANEE